MNRNRRMGSGAGVWLLVGSLFSSFPTSAAEPAPRHWTPADFGGVLSVGLEGHRDYPKGLRLYQALCASCHTLGKHGTGPAPDLTQRALTYTPEELLGHLLSSSKHPRNLQNGSGLLDPLPQADVLDLLAFVLAGADPQSPFFLNP